MILTIMLITYYFSCLLLRFCHSCHDTSEMPIRMKGDTKRTSGNSLSPLGAQNKDIGASSQTLLGMVSITFTSN